MASLTIHELPESDRPRERLSRLGASALTDSELIGILLRTGTRGANAIDIGRQLILKYGSLGAVARCSVRELQSILGIGHAKAVQLAAAFELGNRLARERLVKQRMDSPELIFDLLGAEMRALARESLRVVLLDTKLNLIKVHEVSNGSLNESTAHPREIFQPAMTYSAYAFILVHNHPSGDPLPSEADRRLTTRLIEASKLLQIQMLDHVILGSADNGRQPYFSFRQTGLI
jgi:DNA repair protein RadC